MSQSSQTAGADAEINAAVRTLHQELQDSKYLLFDAESRRNPVGLLNPGVALHTLGFSIQTVDSLGFLFHYGSRTEIAGEIDQSTRHVRISNRFPHTVQRFTSAHELAHASLHPSMRVLHRDRPMDPCQSERDPRERAADLFAARFLMPDELVREWFFDRFHTDRFALDEGTAFALCTSPFCDVISRIKTYRGLTLLLARASKFNSRMYVSLATAFGVSDLAMAIRLEQLDLVADLPPWSLTATTIRSGA